MNIVLYAEDLEPITVIKLPMSRGKAKEFFRWCRVFRVRVWEPFSMQHVRCEDEPIESFIRTVDIWAEPLRRGTAETLMFFTRDEEAALLLRSELLPGQRAEHKEQFRRGFDRGFVEALRLMGML